MPDPFVSPRNMIGAPTRGKIYVAVSGGVVQDILTDNPRLTNTTVTIIDHDCDGSHLVSYDDEAPEPGDVSDQTPRLCTIRITESDHPGQKLEPCRGELSVVRMELGLPISVGVARTKHLAKIASQVAKPDGLVVVDPETELEFLHDLPVELMWGVGPATKARLADTGVYTIGQLAETSPWSLQRLLGRSLGEKLAAFAWNRDPRQIKTHRRAQSAGAQSAIGKQPAATHVFRPTLRHLADRIGSRLRAKSRSGRTVTVRVRFADLRSVTRSLTLPAPISATAIRGEIAEDLVRGILADHPQEKSISLLAISVSNLEKHAVLQLELPLETEGEERRPGSKKGAARFLADGAIDKIRNRFGWEAVRYGSAALGISRSVPDEFRELAEKDL